MPPRKMIAKLLKRDCVAMHLWAATKDEAIDELLGLLDAQGLLKDLAQARADVFTREAKMSTGLKDGLALPHAKSEGVTGLCLALGLKPEGIEFGSLDGSLATMIFLVVSRADRTGPHLQCLAEITGTCREQSVREAVLRAKTIDDVLLALDG